MSITVIIILVTVLISAWGFNQPQVIRSFSNAPYLEVRQKQYYRLLTSGFLHGDLFHLFVNMFVLYVFGEYIEKQFSIIHGDIPGKILFVSFYLFMIVLANLPNLVKHQNNPMYSSIGASGATSAIVFSYIVFNPWSMLQLYFFIPIPAIIFGVLYLWYSSWASKKQADFIDHDAHFYGAVGGFLFTLFMKKELFFHFINELTSILQ